MNNEPVAWMDKKGFVITNKESAKEHGFDIPLYTHPAKELTDEEIIEVMNSFVVFDFIGFARAILKKASEK